ncbi:hypothetical protein AB0H76_15760 [Nocardia sp. NPDC050712]|uniref:DUF6973 domain-containing protein n=1 Tax=Nocardia sp. NPDC050712 TaxID=3155518 RepID=UPI0033C812D9
MTIPTVGQAKDWRPETLLAQADEWRSKRDALTVGDGSATHAVDQARDAWQGRAAEAMLVRHQRAQADAATTSVSLERGSGAAQRAYASVSAARQTVLQAVDDAEKAGFRVSDAGVAAASGAPRASAIAEGTEATVSGAEHTARIQSALANLATADAVGAAEIRAAFSDLPMTVSDGAGGNEKKCCAAFPIDCLNAVTRNNADSVAEDESKKYFPGGGGETRQDACRHCIFPAMLTSWGTETFARCVGEAHERDHQHPDAESNDPDKRRYAVAAEKMDRYNNETGIRVGLRNEDNTAAIIAECVTLTNAAQRAHIDHMPETSTAGRDLIFLLE